MFTFRTTTLLFFLVLILLNLLAILEYPIHMIHYILLFTVYIAVSVAASFFPCLGFHMKAICRGRTEQKVVALTFDDGPHSVNTPLIMDILKDRARATFFLIGKNIEGNEDILKRMMKEGHLIGLHSFSHSGWFDFFSSRRMAAEFVRSEEMIRSITGRKPLLFRPPYGVINPMVKNALKRFNYHVIGYSNRSLDSVTADEERTLQRILKRLRPGDIILLHDTVSYSASLLKRLLFELSERGYIVTGLEELCKIRAYGE